MLEDYQEKLSKLVGKDRADYKAMMYAHVYGGNYPSIRNSNLVSVLTGENKKRRFSWGIDPYKSETPKMLLICG